MKTLQQEYQLIKEGKRKRESGEKPKKEKKKKRKSEKYSSDEEESTVDQLQGGVNNKQVLAYADQLKLEH